MSNADAFWGDDFEGEEEEERVRFPPFPVPLREGVSNGRALLEFESAQPHMNLRHIFRDLDEGMPASMLLREFENDDIIQILLQRSRNLYRQEVPQEPVFQRVFPESSELLKDLANELIQIATEEPRDQEKQAESELLQAELEAKMQEDIVQEAEIVANNPPQEERKQQIPDGVDPSFLEALPEDIRNEILAQYQRPQRVEGINEDFLQALPPELRNEVLLQSRPQGPPRPAAEMDNAVFVASLTPDLRRDVLMTASEEFLSTLPPDLVAEARLLHERINQGDRYYFGRAQNIRKKPAAEEDKVVKDLVNDDKLASSVFSVDEEFIESLIRALYMANPVNKEIMGSLMLNLSVNPINRQQILDALITVLMAFESSASFPPKVLYGADTIVENYSKVYAIVSIRAIEILQCMARNNPKVPFELLLSFNIRIPLMASLRAPSGSPFQELISLMDHSLFRTSSTHLTPLIFLISAVVNKLGTSVPALNQEAVNTLCSLLSFESLNESCVKNVVDMITKLSLMECNKEQVASALRRQLVSIAQEVAILLERLETSANGLKEIQILRICKVIKGVDGFAEDIDFLWKPLTSLISEITQRDAQAVSSTNPTLNKLLPIIEAFFIAHYERSQSETFRQFTDKNSKTINLLVHQNPSLLHETFNSLITRFPNLLDFENKRTYFKSQLRDLRPERGYSTIHLHVRRHEVFMDSYHQLKVRTPEEMHGKLRMQFVGEEGIDAGGLTREWYGLLAREMFNPNYALFLPSSNGVSFQPNSMSSINSEHIQFFKFIGRIIGKAMCDGMSLEVYFTRSFYKHILGQEVSYQDMEDLDVDFYKSLRALMDINLNESDLHEYYFIFEEEEFGKVQVKELVPEGKIKRVTEGNKMDYIKLLCHMKMTKNIQAQIDAFKVGFHELVPAELISIFDSKELELLISGLPNVDIEDLKANTQYCNFTKDSQVIIWMWEVLSEFSNEERAEFIQFVTGSSKVPLEGFGALPGMGGFQKFQVHKSFASTERLPTAHTCINQLDLPEYTTKEELRNKLRFAISEGKEGFGFA